MRTYGISYLITLVLLAATGGIAEARRGSDLLIRIQGAGPAETEDWDSAGGLEAQARFWGGSDVGVSLALGIQNWEAASEFVEEDDGFSYYSSFIEGDASLLSLGGSLWVHSRLSRHLALTVEGGIRYAMVDSRIDSSVYLEDADGVFAADDTIDIDDTWLATVGLNLEAELSPTILLQAGLGYQFDLSNPEETVLGESLGQTDFSAITFNVGVAVRF